MSFDTLKKEITIYLNILYECKYNINIYKKLKLNNNIINTYSYPFIVILNSLINTFSVKLNSIISVDNQKTIDKLLKNCESNKKYVDSQELEKIINEINDLFKVNSQITNNIRIWRDKNMAHSDSKYFGKTKEMLAEHSIVNEDLVNFINLLIEKVDDLYELFGCNGSYDYSIEIDKDLIDLLNSINKKDLYK